MTRIGGALTLAAHSRLHFNTLDHEQQAQAIRRLALTGMSPHQIAHATGLAVEQINRLIDQPPSPTPAVGLPVRSYARAQPVKESDQ